MEKGSGTASSLLWEIERILRECKELNCLPDVLLLENVTQVHGKKNIDNWNTWLGTLEELGYHTYWKDLNSKNYGVAQNRDRCFAISLLSDLPYEFPEPIELKKRLKDYLEPKVDEKYYINNEKAQKLIVSLIERGVLPERERELEKESTSRSENQTYGTLTTVSRQNNGELSISPKQKPVSLSEQGTKFEKFVDVAGCLMSRDYKGFGNQHMTGVIEEAT